MSAFHLTRGRTSQRNFLFIRSHQTTRAVSGIICFTVTLIHFLLSCVTGIAPPTNCSSAPPRSRRGVCLPERGAEVLHEAQDFQADRCELTGHTILLSLKGSQVQCKTTRACVYKCVCVCKGNSSVAITALWLSRGSILILEEASSHHITSEGEPASSRSLLIH